MESDKSLILALSGAIAAMQIIEDCFHMAANGFSQSVHEKNDKRICFWFMRIKHLLNELHWIYTLIKELEADAEDMPPTI